MLSCAEVCSALTVWSARRRENDLVLFHNRGVLHSVVGAFGEDEVRLFRQCNVAASHFPEGPQVVAAAA